MGTSCSTISSLSVNGWTNKNYINCHCQQASKPNQPKMKPDPNQQSLSMGLTEAKIPHLRLRAGKEASNGASLSLRPWFQKHWPNSERPWNSEQTIHSSNLNSTSLHSMKWSKNSMNLSKARRQKGLQSGILRRISTRMLAVLHNLDAELIKTDSAKCWTNENKARNLKAPCHKSKTYINQKTF